MGRLPDIEKHFQDNQYFKEAFAYFSEVLTPNSEAAQRIENLEMNAFDKFSITDEIFAIEQKFYSKARTDCFLESHKKYIDIQMIVTGEELMEQVDFSQCTVKTSYDSERDLIVYEDNSEMNKILMRRGDFAIYFPNDVHLGCQSFQKETLCTKTVIKMPIKFF